MAELADAYASGAYNRKIVEVQVLSGAHGSERFKQTYLLMIFVRPRRLRRLDEKLFINTNIAENFLRCLYLGTIILILAIN